MARGPAPGVLYSTHLSAKHVGGMGEAKCVSVHTCQGPSSGVMGTGLLDMPRVCRYLRWRSSGPCPRQLVREIVCRVIELTNPEPKPAPSPEPSPIYDQL